MKDWKRICTLLLIAAMAMSTLAACGTQPAETPAAEAAPEGTNTVETEAPAEQSEEVLVIKLASNSPANDDLYEYRAGLEFQKKVEEYSNGTMKVEYYPASQLGNTAELVEGVSVGTIEMVMSIAFDYYSNLDPICSVVVMPYLFKDYEHMRAFLEGDNPAIQQIKQSLQDNVDIRITGYCHRPFRSIITMGQEVRTPEDLKGLIYRSPEVPVNIEWLTKLGASPVSISMSELYTSMANGAAQAADNSIAEFYGANFQDIIKCASETNHQSVTCLLTCNNTWYESLTDEQRSVIDRASQDLTDYTWEGFQEASEQAWAAFEAAGVTCIRHDEIDDDAFREASADVYKTFVERGDFTEELYQEILNLEY